MRPLVAFTVIPGVTGRVRLKTSPVRLYSAVWAYRVMNPGL